MQTLFEKSIFMYKCFNLKLENTDFEDNIPSDFAKTKFNRMMYSWTNLLRLACNNNLISVNELKKKKVFMEGTFNDPIDLDKLQNGWFPIDTKADIFISHSHEDTAMVEKLAYWLRKTFNLSVFVDSEVWGNSNSLLKLVDDSYCVLSKDVNGKVTYDYAKRNQSTNQVYLMLSSALHDMIDRCECIFFLNTKNSINRSNEIEQKTDSVWLYDELQTMRLIKTKNPERKKEQVSINEKLSDREPFEMVRDVTLELKNLISLNKRDLVTWQKKRENVSDKENSLDLLYEIMNV